MRAADVEVLAKDLEPAIAGRCETGIDVERDGIDQLLPARRLPARVEGAVPTSRRQGRVNGVEAVAGGLAEPMRLEQDRGAASDEGVAGAFDVIDRPYRRRSSWA